ncbi:hypothetical protein FA95DRAFT_1395688 [Auriscalpium vulgare]|uniref:Uncharacterized protein n=1 Tax=Auriscalpium vulgare TaxID=40419 RepID=A0ACB8RQF0_9AGAM|nr:hypothetical protein FA95DRAFT_1395688 [Auriscalpium vulgare]
MNYTRSGPGTAPVSLSCRRRWYNAEDQVPGGNFDGRGHVTRSPLPRLPLQDIFGELPSPCSFPQHPTTANRLNWTINHRSSESGVTSLDSGVVRPHTPAPVASSLMTYGLLPLASCSSYDFPCSIRFNMSPTSTSRPSSTCR